MATFRRQRGLTLIELLISILIISLGLLGLAKLQMRMQLSDMESYQRAQALLLLNDISSRMLANANNAANYVTGTTSPVGSGMTCPTTTATRQQSDLADWCNSLQGAAEVGGGNVKAGAMLGGRGCIQSLGSNQYMITVAWQGMSPVSAPPTSVSCGSGSYNGTGCANDLCRRVVTTVVRVATL
ncbi:type IV pilus modification protein PilV [Pseudomonas nitroreducens]|uniref:type IV pilus modification protein PilV n=1 Tax=Pseudomonas TaxID=286 RepID=UPI00190F8F99|nr:MULTISPECIES: type IV pilus modification protein PilV [Pseudomonas]MCG8906407.1 type IV pilus modification protein PilV [Pseudomonas sp. DP-17]MDU4253977.1 type IV pilus modification protein PilV [Pseudomonas sp.]